MESVPRDLKIEIRRALRNIRLSAEDRLRIKTILSTLPESYTIYDLEFLRGMMGQIQQVEDVELVELFAELIAAVQETLEVTCNV
jgi:hypothetical protein